MTKIITTFVLKINTHGLILAKARAVHVFRLTTRPKRALPFTMQYGTPILRHNAGINSTN